MTNNEEYEKALNESFNACHNLPKDAYGQIPAGYSMAFNYGYTFGMQQAKSEQKESAKREIDFQREHIATAAMQGLLANSTCMSNMAKRYSKEYDNEADATNALVHDVVTSSIEYADALINELNKKKDENNN